MAEDLDRGSVFTVFSMEKRDGALWDGVGCAGGGGSHSPQSYSWTTSPNSRECMPAGWHWSQWGQKKGPCAMEAGTKLSMWMAPKGKAKQGEAVEAT